MKFVSITKAISQILIVSFILALFPVGSNNRTAFLTGKSKPWALNSFANGKIYRFEVRAGDVAQDSDVSNGNERSEIKSNAFKFSAGTEPIWLSWAFMVEKGSPITNNFNIIGQVHNTSDLGEPYLRPPLVLSLGRGDKLQLNTIADTRRISDDKSPVVTRWSSTIERGRWYRVVLKVIMSPLKGHLTFWLDGDKVFDEPTAVGYNDEQGPYFQYGIYREATRETLAILYQNVEAGSANLEGRVANPLPLSYGQDRPAQY